MKKLSIIIIALIFISININAQEKKELGSKLKVITGVRVNPFMMFDNNDNKAEITRLHGEIGALFNKRVYTSVGYTPFANAIYNFNEYWFIGFDKKVPISWVIAGDYMIDANQLVIQTGPNIKLGKLGNLFVFGFKPLGTSTYGIKIGAFIPLNVVLYKK